MKNGIENKVNPPSFLTTIVGAGLGGLYTAIRLIQHSVDPTNIVLIDPRAGNYTRPGHLNCDVFDLVKNKTGINTIHSSAHHIKELERVMYEKLISSGVRFITQTFYGIREQDDSSNPAILTKNNEGQTVVHPTNFVFDCTGASAHVAQAVNAYFADPPYFTRTPLSSLDPVTTHLLAHVKIVNGRILKDFGDGLTAAKAIPSFLEKHSVTEKIDLLEQLKEFGWHHEAFPIFYTKHQTGTDKLCLYTEAPENLLKAHYSSWIKLMLNIFSNGKITNYQELKPPQKYTNKPRIMYFRCQPQVLNKAVFQSKGFPTVLVGFDALKSSDYRLADGFSAGVKCCERMLDHLTIVDGSIRDVDAPLVEQNISELIHSSHQGMIEKIRQFRQLSIEQGYERFSDIYEQAANELSHSQQKKKHSYQLTAGKLALQDSLTRFSKLPQRDRAEINSIKTLNNCLTALLKARRLTPANNSLEHHDINAKLLSVINELRQEVLAFDFTPSMLKIKHCKAVFEALLHNVNSLDGTFSCHLIQEKAHRVIEENERFFSPGLSVLLNSSSSSSSSSSSRNSSSVLSFFNQSPASSNMSVLMVGLLQMAVLLEVSVLLLMTAIPLYHLLLTDNNFDENENRVALAP